MLLKQRKYYAVDYGRDICFIHGNGNLESRSSKVKRVQYAQVRLGYEINENGSKLSPFLNGEIFALNMQMQEKLRRLLKAKYLLSCHEFE